MLTSDEKLAWLRLIRCKNVGPRTFWELLRMFGSASVALQKLPELVKRSGGSKILAPSNVIEKEIEFTEKFGATFVFEMDEEYPDILRNVDDRPPVLVVKGRTELLKKKGIAVVGSRNASTNGCVMAADLAKNISSNGYAIVSGLAKGIDTAAHKASLSCGTVAVIAGGINHIYPFENKKLFHEIYEQGLVVCEQPFDAMPLSKHFPQRNRIISGVSLGVVVVEAAVRSGTLITARYALEQGREVFAVPGSPLDPRYQGTNSLIKAGAHLVEDAQDVLNAFQGLYVNVGHSLLDKSDKINIVGSPLCFEERELNKYREILLDSLTFSPTSLDDISKHHEVPMHILNYLVVELELIGKIERLFGNKITLCHDKG